MCIWLVKLSKKDLEGKGCCQIFKKWRVGLPVYNELDKTHRKPRSQTYHNFPTE